MTNQTIKNMLLNYEMTDDLLWEYIELDFKETIIGIKNALYELLINCDKNTELINDLLMSIELLAKKETSLENIKVFHAEVKSLTGSIFKNLNPNYNDEIKGVIRRLQVISRYLKQQMIYEEAKKKIFVMESIINDGRSLKIVEALIRDNKDILSIKDSNDENILYKLLKRYSYLDETDQDEINYLYQVILLFINSDSLNIEILKDTSYYVSALGGKGLKHIKQVRELLDLKSKPILLSELESRFGVYTGYPKHIERELNSFRMEHVGAVDLISQPCFTIDGEGTNCLDDAIYLEKNNDGSYTLYVHITYIPTIVPYLSKMNRESIRRVETYYLIDDAYSLYPDYVSNYLASLLPGNIRYTETGIWLLEPDMTIVEDSFKLLKTVIRSRHRLTYEGADEIIGGQSKDDLCRALSDLGVFALKQRERNSAKEVYRSMENARSNNPIHESRFVDKSVSANIVQECALLFGRSKAEYYKKMGLPYIFRSCGLMQKLDLDGSLVRNFSFERNVCNLSVSAYYTASPEAHNGLGYDVYCHGGSPARRSPDGQNQYIDEDLIFNPNFSDKMVYMWEDRTRRLAEYYNEKAQRIDAFSSQYNYLMSKKLIKR